MTRLNNNVIILFSILSVLIGVSLSAALAQNCQRDALIGGCPPPPPPPVCVREHTCIMIDDSPCPLADACTNDTVCCTSTQICSNNTCIENPCKIKCANDTICCTDTQTCTNNICVETPCTSSCIWGGPCCESPNYCKGTACISPCLPNQEHVGPNGIGSCCPIDMMCGNACCGGDAAESYEYGCASVEQSLCCSTNDWAAPVYEWGVLVDYICCPIGYCGIDTGCIVAPPGGCAALV